MSKDPAFLFYSSDFLNGVSDLTMEERGQYITLLCLQHQKGAISEKTIRLSVGSVSVDVLAKFEKDAAGNFFNERLVLEMEKRANFTESRRNNGVKGGRPPKKDKTTRLSVGKPKQNHMEDVNENENKDKKENRKRGAGEKLKLNFGSLQDSFSENWERWIKFKKDQFKVTYKTQESEQIALNELIEISEGDYILAEKIINKSISSTWKGLFPLKQDQNGKSTTTDKPKRVGRVSEQGIRNIYDCEIPTIFYRSDNNGGNDL